MMRRILTDAARSKLTSKRGGQVRHVSLDGAQVAGQERGFDVLALDEALDRLSELDPRKGQVVEMRFFGGLSAEEAAEVLQVSIETVQRDWTFSKAWLLEALSAAPDYES
jgi:RNA polymerase sigma factor (TIGR02999 family)